MHQQRDSTATRIASRPPWLHPYGGAASALLILAVATLAILLQTQRTNTVIPATDWQDAAQHVRDHFATGDVIRIEPIWADAPRLFLEDAPMDLSAEPNREILDQYDRVWVLAGFSRGALVEASMPTQYDLESTSAFGDVDVLRYAIPAAAKPAYSFQNELPNAIVGRVYPTRSDEDCTLWRKDAWHCGRVDKYLYVAEEMRDMGNEPRHCIYAPPIPHNGWVEILFTDVPMGQRVLGRVGMSNHAVRSERGSVTDFVVRVGTQDKLHMKLDPKNPTFNHFEIDTEEVQGERTDVMFRIHADNFFDRFLCFTAHVPSVE